MAARLIKKDRLEVLAYEIKASHAAVMTAQKTGAEKAREAGTALIEAKRLVSHGNWLPWLKGIGLNERTAQEYMQLAGLNEANALRVADLSMGAALREVAQPLRHPAENA